MRKRRRLADKFTIMVCAVLVAVSAFFYAPMEVSAEESVLSGSVDLTDFQEVTSSDVEYNAEVSENLSGDVDIATTLSYYIRTSFIDLGSIDFSSYVTSQSSLYKVSYDLNYNFIFNTPTNTPFYLANVAIYESEDSTLLYLPTVYADLDNFGSYSITEYCTAEQLTKTLQCSFLAYSAYGIWHNLSLNLSFDNIVVEAVSASGSNEYQSGYNAGYLAGEQAGYGNGYSQGFTDGEASVDTNDIYNQGFQAGIESVDTQSYYDAGYQAGYQVAYQEGFNSGYDEGYQSAMDRIDGWGADTTDYPLLLLDKPLMSRVFDVVVKSSIPTRYSDFGEWTTDLNFNPNHTYRFNVVLNPTEYKEGSADIYFLNEDIFYLNVGGIKYRISNFSTAYVNTFFVPGDRMSTAFGFSWEPLLAVLGATFDSGSAYCYYDLNYQIYDMGPSGDAQNHIANQTDQLTNGFNDSKGNSVNNEFTSGLNDFETAEDSLFATATTGMKDFTFFDISSVPAMVTGMSFVGSIMSGWFTQAGGASGVGIVLSILFSIMLVAMVLGLYRWYQSKGGKD